MGNGKEGSAFTCPAAFLLLPARPDPRAASSPPEIPGKWGESCSPRSQAGSSSPKPSLSPSWGRSCPCPSRGVSAPPHLELKRKLSVGGGRAPGRGRARGTKAGGVQGGRIPPGELFIPLLCGKEPPASSPSPPTPPPSQIYPPSSFFSHLLLFQTKASLPLAQNKYNPPKKQVMLSAGATRDPPNSSPSIPQKEINAN